MGRVYLTDEGQGTLLAWAAKRIGTDGWPDGSTAFGVLEDRPDQKPRLRAVIVINAHYGRSCRVHVASDGSRRWATRDVLTRLSAFMHYGMGVERIWTVISARNRKTLIAAIKIGFEIQGRDRCGADDGSDGIIVSILKNENPWLRVRGEQSNG